MLKARGFPLIGLSLAMQKVCIQTQLPTVHAHNLHVQAGGFLEKRNLSPEASHLDPYEVQNILTLIARLSSGCRGSSRE
jgi:hypothetical protein